MNKFMFTLLLAHATLSAGPKIQSLESPRLTIVIERPQHNTSKDLLQQAQKKLLQKYAAEDTSKLVREFELLSQIEGSLQKTVEVYEELAIGAYSFDDALTYIHWVTRLTYNHLSGGALDRQLAIDKLKNELMDPEAFDLVERDEASRGHSLSWNICKKGSTVPYAILKESAIVALPPRIKRHHPLCFSSFQKLLPDMPLTTKVNDHELFGYEMDVLFGFDRTPVTFKATFYDETGKLLEGSLQLFVQDGKSPFSTYLEHKDKAKELLTLPHSKVHLTALSGIFKGLMAHHLSNYLVRVKDGKPICLVEIDLEESMPPYNRIPKEVIPEETVRKSIILCRLAVLGLPQTTKSLDRAFLLIMCHPSFDALLKGYHEECAKHYPLHKSSLDAQNERLQLLQKLCSEALKQKTITITVRELYFAIFGGEELYKIAKEKGYPDLTTFNNLVSDPYQHIVKDFAHPEQIKPCSLLLPPKKRDSRTECIKKLNLQALEP
jgi:hypothetical protein